MEKLEKLYEVKPNQPRAFAQHVDINDVPIRYGNIRHDHFSPCRAAHTMVSHVSNKP